MPALSNHLHEIFAAGLARGLSGTKAAQTAGVPSGSAHARAYEWRKREDVQKRIEEIREQEMVSLSSDKAVDREWVLARLKQIADIAMAERNRTAAIRATELIGKELGMFIERKMDVTSPLASFTPAQLNILVSFVDSHLVANHIEQKQLGDKQSGDGAVSRMLHPDDGSNNRLINNGINENSKENTLAFTLDVTALDDDIASDDLSGEGGKTVTGCGNKAPPGPRPPAPGVEQGHTRPLNSCGAQ